MNLIDSYKKDSYRNVCIPISCGAFFINKVFARARLCVCECVCVCVCVWVGGCACGCACVRVCMSVCLCVCFCLSVSLCGWVWVLSLTSGNQQFFQFDAEQIRIKLILTKCGFFVHNLLNFEYNSGDLKQFKNIRIYDR